MLVLCLYMQITSCLLLLFNQSGAESCLQVSSLTTASAICVKLCIPYLVISWSIYIWITELYLGLISNLNQLSPLKIHSMFGYHLLILTSTEQTWTSLMQQCKIKRRSERQFKRGFLKKWCCWILFEWVQVILDKILLRK